MLEVVGGLKGTTSQTVENQGRNPTENIDMLPRLEGPPRDQHNIGASGRDAKDESSLVGLPSSPLHEAEEITSSLKPNTEIITPIENLKSPSGPSQTKQPKGKGNKKRIAREKRKKAREVSMQSNENLSRSKRPGKLDFSVELEENHPPKRHCVSPPTSLVASPVRSAMATRQQCRE